MSDKPKTYQVRGEMTHTPAIDVTELCSKILYDQLVAALEESAQMENVHRLNKEIITKIDEYYETKNEK